MFSFSFLVDNFPSLSSSTGAGIICLAYTRKSKVFKEPILSTTQKKNSPVAVVRLQFLNSRARGLLKVHNLAIFYFFYTPLVFLLPLLLLLLFLFFDAPLKADEEAALGDIGVGHSLTMCDVCVFCQCQDLLISILYIAFRLRHSPPSLQWNVISSHKWWDFSATESAGILIAH